MSTEKPIILVFSTTGLDGGLKKISAQSTVYQGMYRKTDDALNLLRAHPSARAIWVADAEITTRKFSQLSKEVVEYVRRGGIVVLGGFFTSEVQPSEFDAWMQTAWELPWKSGQYERTSVILQQGARGPSLRGENWQDGLPRDYSSKAVFLEGVAPGDIWYASPDGAVSESMVFGPLPIKSQASVAFTKVGDGWLGYTGDVNGEDGTARATLTMMGLDPSD